MFVALLLLSLTRCQIKCEPLHEIEIWNGERINVIMSALEKQCEY